MKTVTGDVHFYTRSERAPSLEVTVGDDTKVVSFESSDNRRYADELCWRARPTLPHHGEWRFRIDMGNQTFAPPFNKGSFDAYHTCLHTLWVQQGQIYGYQPAASIVQSHVVKIGRFFGRLHPRPLYIYLPRGYHQHTFKRYPVIYMHDGQNLFESFNHESYAGTWRVEQTADRLIAAGQMRECIIVGISNGGNDRIPEYLPPYVRFRRFAEVEGHNFQSMRGRADKTIDYYMEDVAAYIERYYRAYPDRSQRATCGSSMGGLFSIYLAWERPDFARHHAALSPSFWITGSPNDHYQTPAAIERLHDGGERDVRIYLDSGTRTSEEYGDDGMHNTIAARDALLDNGYVEGADLDYFLDEGAMHNEEAWANRLDRVFRFLLPVINEPEPA